MARLAQVAAWGACAAAIGYGVPQVMQVAGMLPDPLDRILIFAPSLALAPLFAVALAALAAEAGRATGRGASPRSRWGCSMPRSSARSMRFSSAW
ncbi:MAG: hypothetical protein WDN24_00390 [Sphingomonas sp.]